MQVSDETQSLRDRVLGFARDIRIAVREAVGEEQGFLPGLGLRSGVTAVIPAREYPGDMPHETGYLAVITLEEGATKILTPTPTDEMAAILVLRGGDQYRPRGDNAVSRRMRRARNRWRKISPITTVSVRLWHDDRALVCVARRSAALSAYAALAALNFPFPGGPA
jgi:hypothetical protein